MSQNSENEEIWISFCQKIILVILQHDTHLGTGTENPVRKTSIQDAPVLAQKLCTWSSVLDVLKSCQCMALDDLLSLVPSACSIGTAFLLWLLPVVLSLPSVGRLF